MLRHKIRSVTMCIHTCWQKHDHTKEAGHSEHHTKARHSGERLQLLLHDCPEGVTQKAAYEIKSKLQTPLSVIAPRAGRKTIFYRQCLVELPARQQINRSAPKAQQKERRPRKGSHTQPGCLLPRRELQVSDSQQAGSHV